jgi:hypothetical protein
MRDTMHQSNAKVFIHNAAKSLLLGRFCNEEYALFSATGGLHCARGVVRLCIPCASQEVVWASRGSQQPIILAYSLFT